jgi:hypothetical protein
MRHPVMVFSHPNHEIAVLGSIWRLKPHIVYLTDGGGKDRVNQTKEVLQAYEPASTHFLMHNEQALYDALLRTDCDFYRALAAQLGAMLASMIPETVYCDAVEFYNPVHDVALPVVRAALEGNSTRVLEVPLIYQKADVLEAFELQRVPESLSAQSFWVELTQEELDRKLATVKSGIYSTLFAQLGALILEAMPSRAAREVFLEGRSHLPSPAAEQVLRYEVRGKALKHSGTVREVITFAAHYAPVFEALVGTTREAASIQNVN